MAVEDELRGGPIIEPKTRIFADQVCDRQVRTMAVFPPPPSISLLPPAAVIILSAVCVCGRVGVIPLTVLPPVRSLCLGLTAVCLPTYLGALKIRVMLFAVKMCDSSWVCERDGGSVAVSVEHVGVKTHFSHMM